MDKYLQNVLSVLGLSAKEIKFYIASFKLGSASINEVAKAARLKRSTAYLICQDLIQKGLITQDFKQYGKKITAVEPKTLLRILSSRQRQLRRQELELEENLPQLQSIYQASEIRPKVRVFEGNNGLLNVFEDILSSQGEILLWTNQQTETQFFNDALHQKFIKLRVQKKIPIRVLAVDNSAGRKLLPEDKDCLRQTKMLPKETVFSAETYIYDNKVAILDYKKDIIGVIIESEPITQSQKAAFETTWKLLYNI